MCPLFGCSTVAKYMAESAGYVASHDNVTLIILLLLYVNVCCYRRDQ